jgi:hypothetical protein
VTVHGEREILPAVSKADGAKALQQFTDGFNAANRKLDPTMNPAFEAGSLLAIDQAGLKAARALTPQGNPRFVPLAFTDAHFTVPKQAGWPKYFLADAVSNRKNTRWFLVFGRDGADAKWRAVYLATFAPKDVPQFRTDRDGYAEAVPAGGTSGLTVDPGALSRTYADYLNTGKGGVFASGPETDGWRAERAKAARQPGARIQWEDQVADFPPVSLRTKDGGALVFFSTYYHQRKTVAQGSVIQVPEGLRGILEGPEKKTDKMAFTTISGQAVKVPAKGSGGKVTVLNRIEAKTSAKAL